MHSNILFTQILAVLAKITLILLILTFHSLSMNPLPQNSDTTRMVRRALGIFCMPFILFIALVGGGVLRASTGDNHVSQHTRAISSARAQRAHSNTHRKSSAEEIFRNAAYQGNAPASAGWNEDMPACFFAEGDDSDDGSGVMADDSNDPSAPVQTLLSDNASITHAIDTREIIHPAKTWFPSVFQSIYQSGAAPPSGGTNRNCQNIWHGGSGGGKAVTLRIIGGELSQNIPEWLDATEIWGRAWRGVAKYAMHTCLRIRVIFQVAACHFHDSNALESVP